MLRLLTMPQKRMVIFFAKLGTILMMTLGLFAIEWIALKLQYIAFTSWFDDKMIPTQGSFEQTLSYQGILSLMYPSSLINFIIQNLTLLYHVASRLQDCVISPKFSHILSTVTRVPFPRTQDVRRSRRV